MRVLISSVERLRLALREHQMLTPPALKRIAGTTATMSVFRKLESVGSPTSYSHRSRFYTPAEVAAFDERGLWEANDSRGQRDCEVGFARI